MQNKELIHSSPESLGIPSRSLLTFLDRVEALGLPMHGWMLLRHGKVAVEGYWPPFHENRLHRMYSVSKSFTSVAVGMMIGEGKLALSDKVAGFFPEYMPENPHPYIGEATVEHLLKMATYNESTAYSFDSPNFVEAFFKDAEPKHKPGALFHYDTAATTVLCAIVENLSGKPMLEYMRPVLDEIGVSKDAWCIRSPEGHSWTGSGILCTMRDLARFALLCMNKGAWNGRQLVSRDYMEAATSKQIDTWVTRGVPGKAHGYGYQFWCLKDGGFGCFGMGSQLALCMPDKDAIFVTTADTQIMPAADEELVDSFYKLLDQMSDEPLPEDKQAKEALDKRLASLSIPLPQGNQTTPLAARFTGTTYAFEPNRFGFRWMRVQIESQLCTLHYENQTGEHTLKLGMGGYEPQLFPETYFGKRIGISDKQYEAIAAGAWVADNALIAAVFSVDDYLGTLKMQLTFYENDLCVFMTKAAEDFFGDYRGYLAGHARP